MKTLEEIIKKNIKHLEKAKEKAMNRGYEAMANDTQTTINVLLGTLQEYKKQNKEDETIPT